MKTKQTAGVRHDFRTDQYVPTLDGKDISPTSFDENRALQIAQETAIQERNELREQLRETSGKAANEALRLWEAAQ